jgi:hypothetical protein
MVAQMVMSFPHVRVLGRRGVPCSGTFSAPFTARAMQKSDKKHNTARRQFPACGEPGL